MGLFNRKDRNESAPGSSVQIPDKLAQRAQLAYGESSFTEAAELYSEAVDKLHTMYVVGDCKYRKPSREDSKITEGLVSAVGAALAMDANAPVRPLAEKSISYLTQIVQLEQARQAADLYQSAIAGLDREIRLT